MTESEVHEMEAQLDANDVMQKFSHHDYNVDVEQKAMNEAHLRNTTVLNFIWSDITVTVTDHQTKEPKAILSDVAGVVHAGNIFNPSSAEASSKLIFQRRIMCLDGTKWLRENHTPQCPRTA
jgi:hypothetical protein